MQESLKFDTSLIVKKWSVDQTNQAATHHGVDPDDLNSDHFFDLGLVPETITINYSTQQVVHNGQTYTLEQWNELNTPKQFIEGPNGN